MSKYGVFIITALFASINCYIVDPGPVVIATKGEVWPKPQSQEKSDDFFTLDPTTFSFKPANPDGIGCMQLLDDALTRYMKIITGSKSLARRGRFSEIGRPNSYPHVKASLGNLDVVNIELTGYCPDNDAKPDFSMVESYSLTLTATETAIASSTIWGILRGLETFSQLVHLQGDTLVVNSTIINDYPRFTHRGLLLDTSRHFIPLYVILQTLDAMSFNKFNVFHWHIVDDHSFPYKSTTFPELSEKGAYHPISKVYEQSDVQRVIEYARVRGIRVIPEFDTPGHTRSWGVAHPELLTECYEDGSKTGKLGPLDPTKNETYDFLTKLFSEVVDVFPDAYFHIGGDEVGFECWESNPDVNTYMQNNNISTYEELESYFIQKVVNILNDLQSRYLVWEEVFLNGVQLPDLTVVHVWRDEGLTTLDTVTKAGKLALYSSCWYLDHLSSGGDWHKYYDCDPTDFPGTDEQKNYVMGGEACMWAEAVNEYNLGSRVWPRASAAAEKLWSAADVKDISEAEKRLEEHTCRMNTRGIPAQPPNGPGVCL